MKYDTVIFDLDGTLLNSLDDLTDGVNYALGRFGYPQRSLEEVKNFVGNGVERLMYQAVPEGTPDADTAACLGVFREYYTKNMNNKTRPYDGIFELLKSLKAMGIKMAIVSNKFDGAVKELRASLFAEYIAVAIGESETVRKKPAPDSIFLALRELDSSVESAIYVGDSDVDVKAAKNAGLKCAGVSWGFRSRSLLEAEGADFIIDSPEELLKIV